MLAIQFGVFIVMIQYQSVFSEDTELKCDYFHPQNFSDINMVLGQWKMIEIIYHDKTIVQGITRLLHCPKLEITSERNGDLKMFWDINQSPLYYNAKISDPKLYPGHWAVYPLRMGTFQNQSYNYSFGGNIQVLKVDYYRMVLTICTRQIPESIFSVILIREDRLPSPEILGSVSNILEQRGFKPNFAVKTCNTKTATSTSNSALIEDTSDSVAAELRQEVTEKTCNCTAFDQKLMLIEKICSSTVAGLQSKNSTEEAGKAGSARIKAVWLLQVLFVALWKIFL